MQTTPVIRSYPRKMLDLVRFLIAALAVISKKKVANLRPDFFLALPPPPDAQLATPASCLAS